MGVRILSNADDPRLLTDSQLSDHWSKFQNLIKGCPFGHEDKVDVDNAGSGVTYFSCYEKGCNAVWGLDGEVIDEDAEYKEEQIARAEMFYDR